MSETTGNATEAEITLLRLWETGMPPRRIAEETAEPIEVIYRRLKAAQKALVKGVEGHEKENTI